VDQTRAARGATAKRGRAARGRLTGKGGTLAVTRFKLAPRNTDIQQHTGVRDASFLLCSPIITAVIATRSSLLRWTACFVQGPGCGPLPLVPGAPGAPYRPTGIW